MRIGICVGEQSGDQLAAGLIKQLKNYNSEIELIGIGGTHLSELGCKNLYSLESIAVMGVSAVLARLPQLLKIRRSVVKYFLENPPDIFIGVDAPDFNLHIEESLRKAGIKTVHYVSPTVWAWRRNRVKKIRRAVDLMLTLFPFEEQFYKDQSVPVRCVGHPLADRIPLKIESDFFREKLELPTNKVIVAVMPGSREIEIKQLGWLFIQTAQALLEKHDNLHFITPFVNERIKLAFLGLFDHLSLNWTFFDGQSHEALAASNFVLATSGTVTLEALLFKKPAVVAYRMSKLNWFIAKNLVKVNYCALPNLLADQIIYPEFIQDNATIENLVIAMDHLIETTAEVEKIKQVAYSIHKGLQKNADVEAAKAVWELYNS